MAKNERTGIPGCAWKRALGDLPAACASSSPNRGVALGGFGAGSFMYNLSGSFGPWQSLDSVMYRGTWLESAAFHFFEKPAGESSVAKCLAADRGLKSSWEKLTGRDATYYALQPKGWVVYHSFKTRLSLKFFSPVIPHNYRETSYPVALFEFSLENPLDKRIECGVMLTFPGVFIGAETEDHDFFPEYKREKGIHSVRLRARKKPGEWCLALRDRKNTEVSYNLNWDPEGDGADIRDDFYPAGRLGNKEPEGGRRSAGALAVSAVLAPGEKRIIPFALAWDFPVVRFGKGTEWVKKYCAYFNRDGKNAFRIARTCLKNYPVWEKKIDAWMRPVIRDRRYPEWLKCAAFNELYYSQFGGIFYSSGLKNKNDSSGLSGYKHLFFEMECMRYPFANTFDVRHYSSLPYVKFWPKIEKDLLRIFARAVMNADSEHQTPHDIGKPQGDPFFSVDAYGTNRLHWKDLHSKFILQCWRYYALYRDRKFLKEVWSACKATYGYMRSTDQNNDRLPDNHGSDNTYDVWGLFGASLLCGGLWVAALEAMKKMARIMKDPVMDEILAWLPAARKNLDELLWMSDKGYYRIDTESRHPSAVMSDGLNGQRYCEAYGLPDILPRERMVSHLRQVYGRCVRPLKDYNNDGVGDVGAVNGLSETGESLGTEQSDEVWAGSTYFLSAGMYHLGLKEEALKTAYGVFHTVFMNDGTAYWFNTPEAWDREGKKPRPHDPEQYQRARAVWELLLEIHDPYKIKRS